eukprot:scaffold51362_cov30-Phaeocystis_antarctica.AAC.1
MPSLFALREMRRASATVCSLGLRASPAMRATLSFKKSRPHRMSPGPLSAAAKNENPARDEGLIAPGDWQKSPEALQVGWHEYPRSASMEYHVAAGAMANAAVRFARVARGGGAGSWARP